MSFGSNRRFGQLFKTVDQRSPKALNAVAMRSNRRALTKIEMLANLFHCMHLVVEKRDERGNRSLEINIVLPKRVVRVDQQRLFAIPRERLGQRRVHLLILKAPL